MPKKSNQSFVEGVESIERMRQQICRHLASLGFSVDSESLPPQTIDRATSGNSRPAEIHAVPNDGFRPATWFNREGRKVPSSRLRKAAKAGKGVTWLQTLNASGPTICRLLIRAPRKRESAPRSVNRRESRRLAPQGGDAPRKMAA